MTLRDEIRLVLMSYLNAKTAASVLNQIEEKINQAEATVICSNDYPFKVHLDPNKAETERARLSKANQTTNVITGVRLIYYHNHVVGVEL